MSTREENLKKINDELEEIAGGREKPGLWFNNLDTDQPNQNLNDYSQILRKH